MSHAFFADAWKKSDKRTRQWYQENLKNVLLAAKEKQARDIDASINLAEELMQLLDEPRDPPIEVPLHYVVPSEDDSLMMPIEQEVLDILYKSTEKGSNEKYLKQRYKKAPEHKFYFRICSNWDYGWQQKQAKQRPRDVNHGRCAILRDTFYRKNNLAPDPPHYGQPTGASTSICSEYSCNFN